MAQAILGQASWVQATLSQSFVFLLHAETLLRPPSQHRCCSLSCRPFCPCLFCQVWIYPQCRSRLASTCLWCQSALGQREQRRRTRMCQRLSGVGWSLVLVVLTPPTFTLTRRTSPRQLHKAALTGT